MPFIMFFLAKAIAETEEKEVNPIHDRSHNERPAFGVKNYVV